MANGFSTEWADRIAAGKVDPEQLGEAIRKTGVLRASPVCQSRRTYHVWLRVPKWLVDHDVTATPQLPKSNSANASGLGIDGLGCGNALAAQEFSESFQPIAVLPGGTTEVAFAVEVAPSQFSNRGRIHWKGKITLPVQLLDEVDPKPLDSPELTELVKKSAGVACSNGFFKDGPSVCLASFSARPLSEPLNSVQFNLKIELLRDKKIIVTETRPDPDERYGEERWSSMPTFVHGEVARGIVLRKDIDQYQIRVTGVPPVNPSRWYRTRYWSGYLFGSVERGARGRSGHASDRSVRARRDAIDAEACGRSALTVSLLFGNVAGHVRTSPWIVQSEHAASIDGFEAKITGSL